MKLDTYILYYVETNLTCIILALILMIFHWKEKQDSEESIYSRAFLFFLILYCVADIGAGVLRGSDFGGAKVLVYIFNCLYIAIPSLLSIIWLKYSHAHIKKYGDKYTAVDKTISIILGVSALAVFSSPFTGFAFTLDENNIYSRSLGAYIVPLLSWGSILYTAIKAGMLRKKCATLEGFEATKQIMVFGIPAFIASAFQVIFYGSTVTQVGFIISILLIFLGNQRSQISKDELTGLFNRRECDRFIYSLKREKESGFVCMMDVRKFKAINDTFGHAVGDEALQGIALILKSIEGQTGKNLFFCRYGGDEFLLISKNGTEDDSNEFIIRLLKECCDYNEREKKPYKLELNYGIAHGSFSDDIISVADKKMYLQKNSYNA